MRRSGSLSPDLDSSEKSTSSDSGTREAQAGRNTIIVAYNPERRFELLHHVTLEELEQIAREIPGLAIANIATVDNDEAHSNKPIKINMGHGNFNRLRLVKELGTSKYYIVRKIHPQRKFDHDTKKGQDRRKKYTREDVFTWTTAELRLHGHICNLNNTSTSIATSIAHNKRNEPQIYQFMPIAEFGDLENVSENLLKSIPDARDNALVKKYLAIQLIQALKQLHAMNFYHRDIKPDNVLLTANLDLKIADFGCSTYYVNENTKLTTTILADTLYMPPRILFRYQSKELDPEQISGLKEQDTYHDISPIESDKLHDLWALGITLISIWHGKDYPLNMIFNKITNDYFKILESKKNIDMNAKRIEYNSQISNNLKTLNIPDDFKHIIAQLLHIRPLNQRISLEDIIHNFQGTLTITHNERSKIKKIVANKLVEISKENSQACLLGSKFLEDARSNCQAFEPIHLSTLIEDATPRTHDYFDYDEKKITTPPTSPSKKMSQPSSPQKKINQPDSSHSPRKKTLASGPLFFSAESSQNGNHSTEPTTPPPLEHPNPSHPTSPAKNVKKHK